MNKLSIDQGGVTNSASVSVVIPTFNRRATIGSAIESALRQSHASHEIIIVDDASTDGTVEYVSHTYPAVRILVMKERQGACSARNAGIDIATGHYIAFLDSDDEFLPNKIKTQIDALSDAQARYATSGYLTDSGHELLTKSLSEDHLIRFNFRGGTSGLLVERDLICKVRFDPRMLAAQDWDVFMRLAKQAFGVHCPAPLYRYGLSQPNRITRSRRRRLLGHVQLFNKNIAGTPGASIRNRITHRVIQAHLAADLKGCKKFSRVAGWAYRALR
ncbi:glycosyltransferase family 2 protein [uncultured Aliiroseovarius sp.]|uniref:glycosyltransferase family 2 protein n=1 Tax=uncultured Aliiroseovarius sp. TaxID=1658783 RepID=UPI00259496D3|nr:glycosyltransferase family 2 protein [uncultured Aliiroseovarius sp.]